MSAFTAGPDAEIATVLAAEYRLRPTELRRLSIGQGTVNYRVCCARRDVFVKCYPPTRISAPSGTPLL